MQSELHTRLRKIALTPVLLVGCDYDGTLAEIVPDPEYAFPDSKALVAFRVLGQIAATSTAVISGRSLRELNGFLGEAANELHVGSHGAEWGASDIHLTPEQQERHHQIARGINFLVQECRGLSCEIKPAGVTLHVRISNRRIAAAAISAAVQSFGTIPGVFVKHGINVVEFMVVQADKGEAVRRARRAANATGVLFIGDDLTDEDAFKTLNANDIGLKVGPGKTHAHFRVNHIAEVTYVMTELAVLRCAWAIRRGEKP